MATDELCTRIFRIAFNVAYRKFHFRVEDAEDVAQEIVVRSLENLSGAPVNVTWAHAGATFLCIDILRRRQRQLKVEPLTAATLPRPEAPALTPADARLLLQRLSSPCAELLYRHFYEGRSFAELDAERGDGRRRCQFQAKRCLDRLMTLARPAQRL